MTADYDVVIVGCGPVSELAANFLGKAGIRTLIVDQATSMHALPRAVHIDHEMVRLCQDAGLTNSILPLMRDTNGHLHVGADGGVIRYMGTAGQARRFGWSNDYFFYQPELEAALRAGFARFDNVDLRLGCRPTGLSQDQGQAQVTLTDEVGEQTVSARYVIASDGANLFWKLGMVLRGLAPDQLLDLYQPEREPHVRGVIGAAVAAGRYISVLDPAEAAARDREMRVRMADGSPRTAADLIPPLESGIVQPAILGRWSPSPL